MNATNQQPLFEKGTYSTAHVRNCGVIKKPDKEEKCIEFIICNWKRMVEGAAMGNLKFGSEMDSAGQEGFCSHVKSITFTDRIIPFLPGNTVKLLFIVHLPCSP